MNVAADEQFGPRAATLSANRLRGLWLRPHSRAAAEAIMRRLPTVEIERLRKVYGHREDVRRYLDERTFTNDQVPA